MIYTIDQLKELIKPVAEKYSLPAMYLFGSYARGEATDESDVDVIIDRTGSKVKDIVDVHNVKEDLQSIFNKSIDLITIQALEGWFNLNRIPETIQEIQTEKVKIYR